MAVPDHSRDFCAGAETRAGSSGALDFQSAFNHAPIGIAISDPYGVLLTVNPVLAGLLGNTPERLVGTTLFDATHPEDLAAAHAACDGLRFGPELTVVLGVRLRDATGAWVPVTVSTAKVPGGDASAANLVMHVEDITYHHTLAEQLRHQAMHDPLTNLPNRALFLQRLTHGLDRHRRTAAPLSVLFCDVDDFKAVNDTHGHPGGDAVLLALADRLRAGLRAGDTAARLGGDEFAVLCENTDTATARLVVDRLTAGLGAPVDVDGQAVTVAVSIGSATSAFGEPLDPVALLKAADTAMYTVKGQRTRPHS